MTGSGEGRPRRVSGCAAGTVGAMTAGADPAVGLGDVRAAAARLAGHVHRTPVLTSGTLDRLAGARVLLKSENFQRVGAFKFRGAFNAASTLTPAQRAGGLAAYSSGNHAQAVALTARLLGTTAVILMPLDTPAGKMAAVRDYGAEVVTYDRYTQDRDALGRALAADRGMALIPPYEHPEVIAGQGTVALELLEQVESPDAVVVPMGGGGLMAGISTVVRAASPRIRVIGVEPAAGDDQRRSLAAGERVRITAPRTIADGLAAEIPGELTFAINRRTVDEIVTVEDGEIVAAMRWLFERMKLVVEPSGAVGVAALLHGRLALPRKRIGVVISGGNIDATRFAALVDSTAA